MTFRHRSWHSVILVIAAAALIVVAALGFAPFAPQDSSALRTTASPVATPGGSPNASPGASPVASRVPPEALLATAEAQSMIIVGEVTIALTDEGIVPAHIESAVGRDVAITVVNAGSRPHNLTIEEVAVDIDLAPGETATVTLTQPPLGEYHYFSDLPGDEALTGTLTVFI